MTLERLVENHSLGQNLSLERFLETWKVAFY